MDENVEGEEDLNEMVNTRVDSSGDSEEETPFDITLAASHSYLGTGLVAMSGRSVLEAATVLKVPVVAHHSVVFPGETVPMLLPDAYNASMIAEALKKDKLYGLLCPDESGSMVTGYGVLCEVFECELSHSEGVPLQLKARAIHRFRFLEMPKDDVPMFSFCKMREVQVVVLGDACGVEPLQKARLESLAGRAPAPPHLRRMDAALTPWPLFVYDIFDFRRLRGALHTYFHKMTLGKLPEEPVSLSFWAASNLPLSARDRLALFLVDSALLRLHMEVTLISRHPVLSCGTCGVELARHHHIFAMSSDGVHSNYTNLGGFMHDLVTVSRASRVSLSGAPSAEFSWFPGYTWTIAHCAHCHAHVGWRFDAQKRSLRPQQFFGLCRNFVVPAMHDDAH